MINLWLRPMKQIIKLSSGCFSEQWLIWLICTTVYRTIFWVGVMMYSTNDSKPIKKINFFQI